MIAVFPAHPLKRPRPAALRVWTGNFHIDGLTGANTMRSILVLSLFTALCASANAATLRHHHARHHVVISHGVADSFAAVPRSAYAPPRPTDPYDDAPSYNDPSKFGGDTALPAN
jgi:hypothetical protein